MRVHEEMTDQRLIDEYCRGEAQAGEELVRRYYERVVQICSRYLHSTQDGQDAAQEVFLKLMAEKRIREFRGDSRLWTWIYRVTLNVCCSHWRKRKASSALNILWLESAGFDAQFGRSPEDGAEENETLERVRKALACLPNKYKEALETTYIKEHSYNEASVQLNITVDTLGVHLFRGRKMLARIYRRQRLECEFALPG